MQNPININSANILTFGFTSQFDLLAKTLTFDISVLTVFNGSGISAVGGICFGVIDPSGLSISDIDFGNPSIVPANESTYVVDLVNGFAVFGWYTITGVIQDADGKQYTITIRKEICQPLGLVKNSYVPAVFSVDADCQLPQVTFSEQTPLTYRGLSPDSVTKAGILSYPANTLANLNFTETPFAIGGSNNVYTGRYMLNNVTTAIYDLQDNVFLAITYKLINFEYVVNCTSSLTTIICCLEDLINSYNNDPYSSTGKAIKAKLDKVAFTFQLALIKEKSGKDASDEVAELSDVLGCDCDCGSAAIEPQPIINGGTVINNINIVGANAAVVTPSTSGNTTTYTVGVKNINVVNQANDTSFTINKVTTGSAITFNILFNNVALATNILNTIQGDEDLINLLNSIIDASGAGIDLSGLNGGCIITMNDCNYTLIEPNNIPKTVVSIVIGGTTYNAPNGLLLTNTASIANWLNGLALGTFTASVDSGTGNVVIASAGNPNLITFFNLSTTAGPLVRQFSRSCVGLVDFLNAVVTYICTLDATKVAFGVTGKFYPSFDSNGNVVYTAVSQTAAVSDLLSNILTAQATLFNSIKSIALTCASIQALFKPSTATIIDSDGLLGTKNAACAKVSYDELAGIILTKIAANSDWQSNLCALVANCTAPSCPPVTNVSAVFSSSGDGSMIVNCNDAGDNSTPIQIRYRVYNSGGTYTILNETVFALPYVITPIASAQYEVGVRTQCANNVWSAWTTAVSNNACTPVVSFGVTIDSGAVNFQCAVTLTSPQTKVQVQMTDPTGNVTSYTHNLGTQSGSFNIPIPTGNYGNYSFIASAICDDTQTPVYQSPFGNPVVVAYTTSTPANFTVSAAYNMVFNDISSGTATGVPTAFNDTVISRNSSAYCATLGAGTISVTLSGTPPTGLNIRLRLVKNGTTIVDDHAVTVGGDYTLNNTNPINSPDTISVEIDQA